MSPTVCHVVPFHPRTPAASVVMNSAFCESAKTVLYDALSTTSRDCNAVPCHRITVEKPIAQASVALVDETEINEVVTPVGVSTQTPAENRAARPPGPTIHVVSRCFPPIALIANPIASRRHPNRAH